MAGEKKTRCKTDFLKDQCRNYCPEDERDINTYVRPYPTGNYASCFVNIDQPLCQFKYV